MSEAAFQAKVIKWLKEQGAYVIKTKPGAGTPVGCPDVICLYASRWAAIECKASPSARFQPGQQLTIDRLRAGNAHVYVAYPENWDQVKNLLQNSFF